MISRRRIQGTGGRARIAAVVAASLTLVVAGCTGGGSSATPHPAPGSAVGSTPVPTGAASAPVGSNPATSAPASASAVGSAPIGTSPVAESVTEPVNELSDDTVVATGNDAEALSVSVSKALFTSAASVVVADAVDAAAVASAAAAAQRAGVPLLLASEPAQPDVPASSAPAATPLSSSSNDPLTAEIRRLGCSQVLATGAIAQSLAASGVHVVADAAALGSAAAPAGLSDVTVLVHAPGDGGALTQAESAAATATAKAAGAAVVAVHGSDPRSDAQAISSLSQHPPKQVLAVGSDFGSPQLVSDRVAVAAGGKQLPGGGQIFFPGRRLVALYGHPNAPSLGVLGDQDLDASVARAKQLAAIYAPLSKVPVVPTFEIIATVAQQAAGPDGNYSGESSAASLLPWVQKASAAGMYVVLDLQPGSANLLTQAKLYSSLLQLPNVGLALDPEWALAPGQQPLAQIGHVDATDINTVASWLSALTTAHHLPQKLLVLHQFRLSMIAHESALKTGYDNLALLIHMDGQGTPPNKDATWKAVTRAAPKGVSFGWKNFYKEDHPMVTPAQTMAQHPTPLMISYQ